MSLWKDPDGLWSAEGETPRPLDLLPSRTPVSHPTIEPPDDGPSLEALALQVVQLIAQLRAAEAEIVVLKAHVFEIRQRHP